VGEVGLTVGSGVGDVVGYHVPVVDRRNLYATRLDGLWSSKVNEVPCAHMTGSALYESQIK